MIVNLEAVRFRPRAAETVAKAYAEELAELSGHASLIAYWDVEVGPLNSAILLWGFEEHATNETAQLPATPSSVADVVTSSEPLLLESASFNEPIEPGGYGPIYEIRIYDYETGSIGTVIDRWAEMVAERRSISRLIGCFSSSGGDVEKWVHIWAYRDGRERELARAEAARRRIWPPDTGEWLLHQENMIVVPAKLSPLQ